MTDRFARFGLLMVRYRWVVVAVWVVLIGISGGILVPKANDVVKGGGFEVPGSSSDTAAGILNRDFHISTRNSVLVVYRSPSLTVNDPAFKSQVLTASTRLTTVKGVTAVYNYYNTGDPTDVSPDKHLTLSIVALSGDPDHVAKLVPTLRDHLNGLSIQHYVTGRPAFDEDTFSQSEKDLKRSEAFTIPIVVILLLLVFQTVLAAAIPLILGAAAVTLSSALVFFLGSASDTSVFALNIASMIGLGLGIDFSLMIVSRLREERRRGQNSHEAIAMTMATSGRSITYSAITVMLSMAVLTVLAHDLMIIRSVSLAVIFVAFTALLAALTLLPAVLGILGHRIEWLRVIPHRKKAEGDEHGFWYRLSHAIMARPWIWLGVSVVILVIIALPLRDIRLMGAGPTLMPSTVESVEGYNYTIQAFGAGRLMPIQIVLKAPSQNAVWSSGFMSGLQQLTRKSLADPRTQRVDSLITFAQRAGIPVSRLGPQLFRSNPQLAKAASQYVNLSGGSNESVVSIYNKYDQYNQNHEGFVRDVQNKVIPNIPPLKGIKSYVGGEAAEFLAFQDSLYGRFPLIVAVIMVIIFVILMMFFQSIFLPIKAMLLNLATVLATYGALVVIFQYNFPTQFLGFKSEHLVGAMTPVMLYAILFGLSTDYEVFMLSRVRELYERTHNNQEAVARGLQATAGIITAAGLILIGTFGSFASASVISVKEVGLGLAIGVFLDTTIVRVIMVPASMRLMGDWNWWMPAWLKKIVPEIREAPAPEPVPALAAVTPVAAAAAPAGAGWSSTPGVDVGSTQVMAPDTAGATQVFMGPQEGVRSPAVSGAESGGVLRASGDGSRGDTIRLPAARPLRIGRDATNELQLSDPSVSRFHARIDPIHGAYGTYTITDLNSSNGVFVNRDPIPPREARPLKDGDTIQIAGMHKFTYTFESQRPEGASDQTVVYPK